MYMEHEALLADPNVDVVCIATPDRLHAPQAIDALNAGKDVYCEKPLTHWSQFELAKKVQEAADKNQRLVQVGTQHMADDNYPEIIKLIGEGIIGKPMHVTCSYFRRGDWGERMPIPDDNAKPGPDLLWERFLGDAPKVDFSVSRFFQWRMYWDYAGGPATDLLVHTFTPIFCILQLDYPERVFGGGGTFQYHREVPDQCNIIADYAGGPSVVMTNSLSNHVPADTIIRGTDGIITWAMLQGGRRSTASASCPSERGKKKSACRGKARATRARLWQNLLDCVRTRQQPKCNIAMAVRVQRRSRWESSRTARARWPRSTSRRWPSCCEAAGPDIGSDRPAIALRSTSLGQAQRADIEFLGCALRTVQRSRARPGIAVAGRLSRRRESRPERWRPAHSPRGSACRRA